MLDILRIEMARFPMYNRKNITWPLVSKQNFNEMSNKNLNMAEKNITLYIKMNELCTIHMNAV